MYAITPQKATTPKNILMFFIYPLFEIKYQVINLAKKVLI
jgi:hypothetical protein